MSQQTAASKAKTIESALKVSMLDPNWSTANMIEQNPLVWMLIVNGIPIDVHDTPREFQEEMLRRGHIPYIPADGPP